MSGLVICSASQPITVTFCSFFLLFGHFCMFSYFGHCIYSAIQLSRCKCVLNKLSCQYRGCALGRTDTASALGRCNNLPTPKVRSGKVRLGPLDQSFIFFCSRGASRPRPRSRGLRRWLTELRSSVGQDTGSFLRDAIRVSVFPNRCSFCHSWSSCANQSLHSNTK